MRCGTQLRCGPRSPPRQTNGDSRGGASGFAPAIWPSAPVGATSLGATCLCCPRDPRRFRGVERRLSMCFRRHTSCAADSITKDSHADWSLRLPARSGTRLHRPAGNCIAKWAPLSAGRRPGKRNGRRVPKDSFRDGATAHRGGGRKVGTEPHSRPSSPSQAFVLPTVQRLR